MLNPRVGIDLHAVNDFYQGLRTHVLNLFPRVIEMSPELEFYLFLDHPEVLRGYSESFNLPNVHRVRMPKTNPVVRLCVQLPWLQRKYRLDLLHVQNILPLMNSSPCIATIHDVLFEAYPQFFKRFSRLRSRALMRAAAAMSRQVFTVSEYCKKEIIQRYPVKAENVDVLYNGVDTSVFHPGDEGRSTAASAGLTPGGYILTVGRLDARKNHVTLLRAYAKLRENAPELVIVGQRDFGYRDIYAAIDDLGLKPRVRILEDAGDDMLPALYRHAKLFVYPSWAEGFGMPPVEAMASGVPVICSNTTSLPEIVGSNGILVDPGDAGELASAMSRVLSDEALARKLSLLGPERAGSFQWEASARKVRGAYLACLEHEQGRELRKTAEVI